MSEPDRCQCGAVLAGRHRASTPTYVKFLSIAGVSMFFSGVTFLAVLAVLQAIDEFVL